MSISASPPPAEGDLAAKLLTAALGELLAAQPSLSLRDARVALQAQHPDQAFGSRDIRLVLKQLRAAGSADPNGARRWSVAPYGDAEAQRRDAAAGFSVSEDFAAFSQRDDVFCRSFWDPAVRSRRSQQFWQAFAPLSLVRLLRPPSRSKTVAHHTPLLNTSLCSVC
jgi:hypothetical protein